MNRLNGWMAFFVGVLFFVLPSFIGGCATDPITRDREHRDAEVDPNNNPDNTRHMSRVFYDSGNNPHLVKEMMQASTDPKSGDVTTYDGEDSVGEIERRNGWLASYFAIPNNGGPALQVIGLKAAIDYSTKGYMVYPHLFDPNGANTPMNYFATRQFYPVTGASTTDMNRLNEMANWYRANAGGGQATAATQGQTAIPGTARATAQPQLAFDGSSRDPRWGWTVRNTSRMPRSPDELSNTIPPQGWNGPLPQ